MKSYEKAEIKSQFIEAAKSYIQSKGVPADAEGDTVKCAIIIGTNGYDVSLWAEPQTSRFYCECLIRNVFPGENPNTVRNLLELLIEPQSQIGGRIGISRSGDLQWMTYCEAPGCPVDEALVHEVITVGVGKFNQIVSQVRPIIATLLANMEPDDPARGDLLPN
jgi:hypothetical protein